MQLPVVAVVGRANVGKSTLFNRLIGARISIVENHPGVTRDRIYGQTDWNGRNFHLIDTGGIELNEADEMVNLIRVQAQLAIDEADVIVFLVDGKDGITGADQHVADLLRRSRKPIVLAVNKLDHPSHLVAAYEFSELGLGNPIAISAEHGEGTGDLLDEVVHRLPDREPEAMDTDVIRVALIGRPNVGKSSLVNAILGEQRVLVSPVAGTTRDAIDTPVSRDGQDYVLIDTAGMRRRGRIYEQVERYSYLRAMRAVERADVALIIIDGYSGITEGDKRVAGYAVDAGRAGAFVVNKWDIVEKDDKSTHQFELRLRDEFPFMRWAPVVFVSAVSGQRISRMLPLAQSAAQMHAHRIPTSTLNAVIRDAVTAVPPPPDKGRNLRLYYAAQVSVKPPTFTLFVNNSELMHFSYQRYLENRLREAFGFEGSPMRIVVRSRS